MSAAAEPKNISKSTRAGLKFPVGRVASKLKGKVQERVSETAPVFLAATLEYLVAEIVELAGRSAKDNKRKRVTPRDLMLAIRNDAELTQVVPATISGGGNLPHIERAILPPSKPKKAAA